jgi:hypothetical protein
MPMIAWMQPYATALLIAAVVLAVLLIVAVILFLRTGD